MSLPPRRNPRRGSEESSSPLLSDKKRARADNQDDHEKKLVEDAKKPKNALDNESTDPVQLNGIALELSSLKDTLQHLVLGLRSPAVPPPVNAAAATPTGDDDNGLAASWGVLRNRSDGTEVCLTDAVITIGRSTRCTVPVPDAKLPGILARIRLHPDGIMIECFAGMITVNDVPLRKLARTPLKSLDQISLIGHQTHIYTFAQSADNMVVAMQQQRRALPEIPERLDEDEPKMAEVKKRLRVSSDSGPLGMAPPPVLPPMPNLEQTGEMGKAENAADTSAPPPLLASSPVEKVRAPSKLASRAGAPVPMATLLGHVAIPGTTPEERVAKMKALTTEFSALVIKPQDNVSSFEEFPYHVNESTMNILLDSLSVFLNQPQLVSFTKQLNFGPQIVLEGPFGTELYQTELLSAVAKKHNVSLLVIDSPHPILVPDPTHSAANPEEDAPASTRDSVFGGLLRAKFTSTASTSSTGTKKTLFKKGDRVRFIGNDDDDDDEENDAGNADADGKGKKDADSDELLSPSNQPRGPTAGMAGEVVLTFDEDNRSTVGVAFDVSIPGGVSFGGACDDGMGYFVKVTCLRPETEDYAMHELEGLCVDAIMQVAAENAPIVVCFRDIEGVVFSSYTRFKKFQRAFKKLPGRVVVVGLRSTTSPDKEKTGDRSSATRMGSSSLMDFSFLDHIRPPRSGSGGSDDSAHGGGAAKMLSKLMPTRIAISAPARNPELAAWKKAMEEDIKMIKARNNTAQLKRLLAKCKINVNVAAMDQSVLEKEMFSPASLEKVLGWAVGHAARSADAASVVVGPDQCLELSAASVEHAFHVLRDSSDTENAAQGALRNVVTENDFEKKILSDVVPVGELNVTFAQIGALEKVKQTLRELVMLPLTRPELFRKGSLTKPTKGVLLFGPPGTGKTMLAKAVATECKANFINVSMASIGSKWFGEGEKYAQAIFTLASKISPAVIFIDEVDSILGKRDRSGEHEAMRKIKNTIMSMWDGLKTVDNERVIVLAASNRPFDLDDAVLRRLPRRMMVDLPDCTQREQILRVICEGEEIEESFEYEALARITEGYSGSDLRNLCVAAAYVPIREILEEERKDGKDPHASSAPDAPAIPVRPLKMADFVSAREQVSSSVSEDAASISELREWNSLYGEGGDRQKKNLSYYM